jgi:hypothetical protein
VVSRIDCDVFRLGFEPMPLIVLDSRPTAPKAKIQGVACHENVLDAVLGFIDGAE